MYCLKCGRETTGSHVFCDSCQKKMASYPIAPGTTVHLPPRDSAVSKKAVPRKRAIPLEDQLAALRKSLRRTRTFALVMVIVLVMITIVLLHRVAEIDAPIIGQNYTIDTEQTAD